MPTNPENPGESPGSFGLKPDVEDEARALIDASLNGRITTEQHQRLEQMVVGSEAVARLYLELVHLWYIIPLHVTRAALDLNAAEIESRNPSDDPMDLTMIMPALHEADLQDDDFELIPPPGPTSLPVSRRRNGHWWRTAAAVLAVGLTVFAVVRYRHADVPGQPAVVAVRPETPKPSAIVTGTAAISVAQSQPTNPGMELAAGDTFQIADGAAELTFGSGAVAVVRGPARLRVVDYNSVILESGSMTAHVPPAARGFGVLSPGLSVVDRGTNFGVRALAGGHGSEVQVFGGKVDVGGVDSTGKPTSATIHLTEGQAVKHDPGVSLAPVPVAYAPSSFIHDIASVDVPVPLHNTGDQVVPGNSDPNWQLISVAQNPGWQPRPAFVMVGATDQYTRFVAAGTWIGVNRAFDTQPVGDFVFRTTVDLSEVDPASVAITANVAADDFVADIKINGVSAGVTTLNKQNRSAFEVTALPLPASLWRKGVNQIDVVVTNRAQTFTPNCIAFHLDWTATGTAAVHR